MTSVCCPRLGSVNPPRPGAPSRCCRKKHLRNFSLPDAMGLETAEREKNHVWHNCYYGYSGSCLLDVKNFEAFVVTHGEVGQRAWF
jgi:hypothetical protein